jgi:hypothetical protein
MAIVFHCEHCGKKIEAQDNAGGKRGKCPACHNTIYVPSHVENEEPLHLAPLDEQDENQRSRLLSETYQLTQNILEERALPEESTETTHKEGDSDLSYLTPLPSMDAKELKQHIVQYLRLMADGKLDEAAQIALFIVPQGDLATGILDSIALSEMPEPELSHLPPHILSGLIRTLRAEITS